MLTITDFDEHIGLTRYDAENWRRRVGLLTSYKATTAGKAQEYSRENVLELAATAAFVKSGMQPKAAIAYANSLIRASKIGTVQEWLIFPAGDYSAGISTDNPTAESLREMSAKSATGAVVAIPQRQIVERVDALFSQLLGG
ncbi:hypothetical protein [Paracoccus shanxieyensis]|uniref:MerR family transcriptional regulator n=1 Tax=Paracoccus shanxieyensis TaxID=2675752 RepID=A0A6L6J005_9RHOB|nr:hypothetical protein [Paracoccus shanxieyensis]MTH65863.1 hypothetical protein [Paracoccus shanxieyensis]MTH89228.1 hypothetical protein [Paracoccus shanxieyensis]